MQQTVDIWSELEYVPAQVEQKPEPASVRRGHSNQAPYLILYVEDILSNIKLVERLVRDRPAVQLLVARKGREAVAAAREHRPDLVLLDLHLPDISGYEVLEQLCSDERTKGIPVVVISADAMADQIERVMAAGVREYLTKPIDIAYFMRMLDWLMIEGGHHRASDTSQ